MGDRTPAAVPEPGRPGDQSLSLSRRQLLRAGCGISLAAVGFGLVAACGGDDDDGSGAAGERSTQRTREAQGRETPKEQRMYATIRRYEGVTDPAEAGRRVEEGFVPLISGLPGFVAYYWIDAGDSVMASTSVFEDRAGAEASTETAANWVRENIAELLPNPPQVTTGEVVATG
jgi:hypothetical protein